MLISIHCISLNNSKNAKNTHISLLRANYYISKLSKNIQFENGIHLRFSIFQEHLTENQIPSSSCPVEHRLFERAQHPWRVIFIAKTPGERSCVYTIAEMKFSFNNASFFWDITYLNTVFYHSEA